MDRTVIEGKVKQILGDVAGIDHTTIPSDAHIDDLEIESMNMLVLWESLERVFSIVIGDRDVGSLTNIAGIAEFIAAKQVPAVQPDRVSTKSNATRILARSNYLGPDDIMFSDLEIGMHLTGGNNLAETPLLREIGHLRWQHMSAITGVPSKDVVDEEGERLYPTFFYVEVVFPPSRPMASYGENDHLTVVSTLRRFGLSMLDGEHYLYPAHWHESQKHPPSSPEQSLQEGVPYLHFSNSFVKQWRGAEWLKQSRPINPGFSRIREMAKPPDSYAILLQAKEKRPLFDVPDAYAPLTPGPLEFDYRIIPDRDLNAAGLLYFANYPMFLDIAERTLLSTAGELAFDESLLDRRTLVHRKSVYLSNATAKDVLTIKLQAWIENPFLIEHVDPATAPIRLLLNFEMYRQSDERLMLVSTARKIVMGQALGETNLLDRLQARVD